MRTLLVMGVCDSACGSAGRLKDGVDGDEAACD
jgi:hypothetical protein